MRMWLALAAAFILVACSPAARVYPEGAEQQFMLACERESEVPGLCACTWERIAAEIDPSDFAALERLAGPTRDAHPVMRQIIDMRQACYAALSPPTAVEPAPAE